MSRQGNVDINRGPPVAIISGGGSLPFAVADAANRHNRRAVLLALRGFADAERVEAYPHHWVGLGEINRIQALANQEGCRDLVFIGAVVRPSIRDLRIDFGALGLLPRLIRLLRSGDSGLLSGVIEYAEERGFAVVGAQDIAPEILMPEGPLGHIRPTSDQSADIARGLELLHAIGPFDVGQAAVLADGRALAIEGAGGTDEMLAHLADLRRRGRVHGAGGVLVKAPKPTQDRRIDLPTIGPRTIEGAAQAGLVGVAVAAGEALIAEADRIQAVADAARIFVVGISRPGAP
jgi:UDP-2,3-diacylglucosamine hydrolase